MSSWKYEVMHRVDLVVTVVAFLGWILSLSCRLTECSEPAANRFLMSLIILRVFVQHDFSRNLIYPLFLKSFQRYFTGLLFLMWMIIYIFAVYGSLFFSGKFSLLGSDAPPGSFDSVKESSILLFQIFTLSNWDSIMFATITAHGWSAAIYFMVFVVIIAIIFTNGMLATLLNLRDSIHRIEDRKETHLASLDLRELKRELETK